MYWSLRPYLDMPCRCNTQCSLWWSCWWTCPGHPGNKPPLTACRTRMSRYRRTTAPTLPTGFCCLCSQKLNTVLQNSSVYKISINTTSLWSGLFINSILIMVSMVLGKNGNTCVHFICMNKITFSKEYSFTIVYKVSKYVMNIVSCIMPVPSIRDIFSYNTRKRLLLIY